LVNTYRQARVAVTLLTTTSLRLPMMS